MLDQLQIQDLIRTENFFLLMILIPIVLSTFYRKIGFIAFLTWVYFALISVWRFSNPWLDDSIQFRFDASAAYALCYLIILPVSVIQIYGFVKKRKFISMYVLKFLYVVATVESLFVIFQGWGALNVGSMDGMFLAMLFPIFWAHRSSVLRTLIMGLMAFAIAKRGATTAMLMVMVSMTPIIIKKVRSLLWLFIPIGLCIFFTGKFQVITHSGRLPAWNSYIHWWWNNAPVLFGAGTGTFEWLAPGIWNQESLIFAHNEFLQALFEGGFVGLGLLIAFGISLLWKSRHDPFRLGGLMGFGVAMMAQFPFRLGLSAMLMLFVVYDTTVKNQLHSELLTIGNNAVRFINESIKKAKKSELSVKRNPRSNKSPG